MCCSCVETLYSSRGCLYFILFCVRFGGKILFGAGVFGTSVLTLLTPIAARTSFSLLIALRIAEGIGEVSLFDSAYLCQPTQQNFFDCHRFDLLRFRALLFQPCKLCGEFGHHL